MWHLAIAGMFPDADELKDAFPRSPSTIPGGAPTWWWVEEKQRWSTTATVRVCVSW
jgi:hypothetical protein